MKSHLPPSERDPDIDRLSQRVAELEKRLGAVPSSADKETPER
ncbi:TPA: hypothetical protein ACTW8P_002349 [Raoultella ornithinolytica]